MENNAITIEMKGAITAANVIELRKQVKQSVDHGADITVCLKDIKKVDLAGFNTLVHLFIAARRLQKKLRYVNCHEQRLVDFIDQTHFNHVFITA